MPIDSPSDVLISSSRNSIDKGFVSNFQLRFGSFWLDVTGKYIYGTLNNNASRSLPRWSGDGGLYFWDKIVQGHLDLKTGIRARAFSSSSAVRFDGMSQVYYDSSGSDIGGTGVLDYVVIGHIGSAYLHFVMENLLDREYVTTSFYPMKGRQLHFGISWDFLN